MVNKGSTAIVIALNEEEVLKVQRLEKFVMNEVEIFDHLKGIVDKTETFCQLKDMVILEGNVPIKDVEKALINHLSHTPTQQYVGLRMENCGTHIKQQQVPQL